MWGGVGRGGEVGGGAGRCGEVWGEGDVGRWGEMWGADQYEGEDALRAGRQGGRAVRVCACVRCAGVSVTATTTLLLY